MNLRDALIPALPLALAACLALGGCGKKEETGQKTAAGGELLPRSVGDDMLPYDTVRSQPSLSPPDETSGADALAGSAARGPKGGASQAAQDPADGPAQDGPAVDAEPAPAPGAIRQGAE